MANMQKLQEFFRCLSWLEEKAYHGGIYFGTVDGRLGVWHPANCGELGEAMGKGPMVIDAVVSARKVNATAWHRTLALFCNLYEVRDGGRFFDVFEYVVWLEEKARTGGVFVGEVDCCLGVWCSVGLKENTPSQARGDNILDVLRSAMLADIARVKKPCDMCDTPLDPTKETLIIHTESDEDDGLPVGYFLEVRCDGCGESEIVVGW